MPDRPEILPYAGPRTPPNRPERSRVGCASATVLLIGVAGAGLFLFLGTSALIIAFSNGVGVGLATLPFSALGCWVGAALFKLCLSAMLHPDDPSEHDT